MKRNPKGGLIFGGLAIVVALFIAIGLKNSPNLQINIDNNCSNLSEYIKAVYAPRTMQQFKDAKESASGHLFTEAAANRFFVSYGTELTEADLQRSCMVYTTHGKAEMQSDGIERYLADVYLYNNANSAPTKAIIVFLVNSDNQIYDFKITLGV